jgi:hypothetical protein
MPSADNRFGTDRLFSGMSHAKGGTNQAVDMCICKIRTKKRPYDFV